MAAKSGSDRSFGELSAAVDSTVADLDRLLLQDRELRDAVSAQNARHEQLHGGLARSLGRHASLQADSERVERLARGAAEALSLERTRSAGLREALAALEAKSSALEGELEDQTGALEGAVARLEALSKDSERLRAALRTAPRAPPGAEAPAPPGAILEATRRLIEADERAASARAKADEAHRKRISALFEAHRRRGGDAKPQKAPPKRRRPRRSARAGGKRAPGGSAADLKGASGAAMVQIVDSSASEDTPPRRDGRLRRKRGGGGKGPEAFASPMEAAVFGGGESFSFPA